MHTTKPVDIALIEPQALIRRAIRQLLSTANDLNVTAEYPNLQNYQTCSSSPPLDIVIIEGEGEQISGTKFPIFPLNRFTPK